jgi:hypothetical protein
VLPCELLLVAGRFLVNNASLKFQAVDFLFQIAYGIITFVYDFFKPPDALIVLLK